jgi:hypothetical protein
VRRGLSEQPHAASHRVSKALLFSGIDSFVAC